MRVRLLHPAGSYPAGVVVDLPTERAARLIALDLAERADAPSRIRGRLDDGTTYRTTAEGAPRRRPTPREADDGQ